MKTIRQMAILDLIEKQAIETQEDLAEALRARGIKVTQATVSRDIKELRLLKVLTPAGLYKYATADKAENGMSDRLIRMLFGGTRAGYNTFLLFNRAEAETAAVVRRLQDMIK